jgi:hypothetical protein
LYDILRIKKDESSLLVGDGENGIVCHLVRSGRTANNYDERSLSTPVIVRKLAFASLLPNTNNESSSSNAALPTHNSSSEEDGTTATTTMPPSLLPILYIPPCLAATLGLLMLHTSINTTNTTNTNNTNNSNNNNNTIMGGVYYCCDLQPIQKCEIYIASHVTVRELGKLPPSSVVVPSVKYPISILDNNNNNNVDEDDDGRGSDEMEKEEEERKLKHYFFSKKVQKENNKSQMKSDDNNFVVKNNRSSSGGYKPRQRLLALGSIFAVPSSVQNDNGNDTEKMLLGDDNDDDVLIQNVRFYQIVNVQCHTINSSRQKNESLDENKIPDGQQQQQQQRRRRLAYIISPSTQLVLLSCTSVDPNNNMYDNSVVPMLNGYTVRLPCIPTTISFLRSISVAKTTTSDVVTATTATTTTPSHGHNHPSMNDVIDALYLQSAIPSMNSSRYNNIGSSITQDHTTRIINIVGKEENHICHCIDEACNIS